MNPIVQVLTQALEQALDPRADQRGLPVARDVAQVLGLEGLDRALGACRPGTPDTAALEHRLRELLSACRGAGDVRVFVEADASLGRLAAEHGAVVPGTTEADEGTLVVLDALDDMAFADSTSRALASRTRLSAPVAAALRATLDWLCGDERKRPVYLRVEDSALELVVARVSPVGVRAADAVLSSVGGSLGPTLGGRTGGRGWLIRVPIATPRATYLLLVQGGLKLAVPWHSVLRLCMTARVEFETNARSLTSPVLSPRVPLASGAGDHPVVLIAHGLRRAYLVADQLIWKLPADPVEMAPDPRAPELGASVRTDDGETFRVADPAILLAEVASIPVPDLDVRGTEVGAEAGESKAEPIPSVTPATVASSPSRPVPSAPAPQLAMIEPERVTPLPLRALIADDSISTRLYLARQLEPTGFEVRSVATAAELMRELDAGSWSVAFVDVDLPDARGREFLENVRARARARGVEVVALVRDGAEVRISGEAGVTHSLSKPLEREVLKLLMNQLGFGTGEG